MPFILQISMEGFSYLRKKKEEIKSLIQRDNFLRWKFTSNIAKMQSFDYIKLLFEGGR
jgi:hypothetical protein